MTTTDHQAINASFEAQIDEIFAKYFQINMQKYRDGRTAPAKAKSALTTLIGQERKKAAHGLWGWLLFDKSYVTIIGSDTRDYGVNNMSIVRKRDKIGSLSIQITVPVELENAMKVQLSAPQKDQEESK